MTTDPLDIARRLIAHGAPVFVAKPGGRAKGYHVPAGWQTTPADPATLADFRPGDALGMVCGYGLDVIDVDMYGGRAGAATVEHLTAVGALPEVVASATTPSGGLHLFVRSLGVRKGKLPGVDVQSGTGGAGHGFVFIAPTVAASKVDGVVRPYGWQAEPSTDAIGPEPNPASADALRGLLGARSAAGAPQPTPSVTDAATDRERAYIDTAVRAAAHNVTHAAEGTRNDTLNAEAHGLYRLALGTPLDADAVTAAMTEAAALAGLDADEVATTLGSAARAARKDGPRTVPQERPRLTPEAFGFVAPKLPDPMVCGSGNVDPRGGIATASGAVPPGSTTDAPGVLGIPGASPTDALAQAEAAVFEASDVLGAIRQGARARLVSPWAVLGCVLARVVAETPVPVVLPPVIGGDASLNLAVALVAPSGGGKTGANRVAQDLLGGVPTDPDTLNRHMLRIRPEQLGAGSGEGIVAAFLDWVAIDPSTPGAGRELRLKPTPHAILVADEIGRVDAVQSRNGSSLGPVLRSAITGDSLTTTNAARERNRKVPELGYRFAAVVGVQPELSGILLDDADAGTPQRWLWLPAADALAPDEDDTPAFPTPLAWLPPHTPVDADGRARLSIPDEAARIIRDNQRARLRGHGAALDGHALLTREKVAAALSLLHGHAAVTSQWWEVAASVMAVSDGVRGACVATLAGKADERTRAAGRRDAIRDGARAEALAEDVAKYARLLWQGVQNHHTAEARLPNMKHDPGAGCTRRCLTRALRHHPAADVDKVAAQAEALGWLDRTDADRWTPGDSQPADATKEGR